MAWESSSSRCQVAIFYNTQTQWLDSSLIIKKGLCAFNNPGKGRIKQIFQELQHQRRVGGADSARVWLARRWDDTVTAFFISLKFHFQKGNWRHQRRTRDHCWIRGQRAERRQHLLFFFFWRRNITRLSHTYTWQAAGWEQEQCCLAKKKKKTDVADRFNSWG